jgi:hypothetical protein
MAPKVMLCRNGDSKELSKLPDGTFMYRAVDDRFVPDVLANGFLFPHVEKAYAGYKGGLGFALDLVLVRGYAENKDQDNGHHFFACRVPNPAAARFGHLDRDHPMWGKCVDSDRVMTGTMSGNHIGDEYLKARESGNYFAPDELYFVQF